MTGLKIRLFGEFQVRRGRDLIERKEWGRQKARSLLKLLLTRPGRAFPRDEILDALWPGVSPASAERSLRVTVSLLRRTLEPDLERGSGSRYVLRQRHGYLFDRAAGCEVDAWEVERHWDRAEAARKAGELDEAVSEYWSALELLRGDFLAEEPYEDWAMEAREGWRARHLSVLSGLAECLGLRGRYTEAIEACGRALGLDWYREETHRRLMLFHYCAGEQGLALRAYRDYARLLGEDLGATPSSELTDLKQRIEARDVPGVDALRRYPRPRRTLRFPYSLSRTHFVGREEEYALLAERLRETTEGFGGIVAVEGEAGVGKTRLAEEFLGYARSQDVRVLSGRCYERELGPPLEPITDALVSLPATGRTASGEPVAVGEELGYSGGAELYDGTQLHQALFREFVRRSRDADHKALVLFVDDLQWADPATLEFLSYLAKRISGERILLVATYRREDAPELSGWMDDLSEHRAVITLGLERLSLENTKSILDGMSSRRFGDLASLAEFLQEESEGNPFYALEYLRWLIESGTVEVDPRRRISSLKTERLRESILPSGVRSLVRSRLGKLDDGAGDLLKLAAVVGRTFDLDLLCGSAACSEAQILNEFESLLDTGLIVGVLGNTYHFSHDKLRQVLYESISFPRRRALHLRVAKVLQEAGGEPAELAHHYLRAEAWRPALENLVEAARRAEDSYAWKAALNNLARALDIADMLPNFDEDRFELLASRERLLEHIGHREARAATVREMFDLADRLGDRGRTAEVHVRRMGVLATLSDLRGAEEAGWAAVGVFRELKNKAGEARAHREMGYVLWMNGDTAGSLQANLRALQLSRELGDRRREAGDMGNIAEVYRGMGDYDQALQWAEEAILVYQQLGNKLGQAMRLATVATIHRERGDPKTALRTVLETLRLYTELGTKNLLVAQHSACGTLYLGLGIPRKALEHFRIAIRISGEIGHTRDEGYSLMSVGVCLEQTGDHAGAADAYRQAGELLGTAYEESGATKELVGKADAKILLAGTLHRSLVRPVEALGAYEAAVGICRKLGEDRRLRKLLLGMAGLRWRMGDPEGSARDYEEVACLAREHGEPTQEAAALASLGVVYRDLGRLRESVRRSRESLQLMRSLDDPQAEAYVLSSLAESYRRRGHHPSALSCLRRSLRLRQEIGDKEGEAGVLQDLTMVHEELGDPDRVRARSEEANSNKRPRKDSQIVSGTKRRN